MRDYIVSYYVGDDSDSVEFQSEYRRGSKQNKADALMEIHRRKGNYIADRAEIFSIQLDKQ